MTNHRFTIALSILASTMLACGVAGAGLELSTEPPPPAATDSPSETDVPVVPVAATETPPPDIPPAEPTPPTILNLDDPTLYNQPAGLTSYLTTLDFQFEAPGPITGSVRMEGATQVEPYETTLEFETAGRAVLGGGEMFYFTQILDTQYVVYTGFSCITGQPGIQQNPFEVLLDTGGMLKGEAQWIGEEIVNDIPANVYAITLENIETTDPAGLGVETINESRIYVAKDGNYVVRLFIDGSGRASVLSGDSTTAGDVYYEVNNREFDVPVDVQIPPDCPGYAPDIIYPIPANTADLVTVAGVAAFDTPMTLDEVVTFYTTEMPALGCSAPQTTAADPVTTLMFECTTNTIYVVISPNTGGGLGVTIFKAL